MIHPISPRMEGRLAEAGLFGLGKLDEPVAEAGTLRHAFRIGQRWLLIPEGIHAEMVGAMRCASLPFSADWCLGLANFRGEPVPIYDLAILFGDTAHKREGARFLVLGRPDARAGVRIDEIAAVSLHAHVEPSAMPALPGLPSDLDCTSVSVEGTTYIETDLIAWLGVLALRASTLAA